MKALYFIVFSISLLFLSCEGLKPKDIRNEYLRNNLSDADYQKGKELLHKMQEAYGGKNNWLDKKQARFVQVADWYGNNIIGRWDTLPQIFEMISELGEDNSSLILKNGPTQGTYWAIKNGETFSKEEGKEVKEENETMKDKLLFKNYWFQFPFRISEADYIIYAGKEKVGEKEYELIYATWGSEEANTEYDQFILYLDPATLFIEYLYFTVRDKARILALTARFDDFKSIDSISLPHSQFVTKGKPGENGLKFHENHYLEIEWLP